MYICFDMSVLNRYTEHTKTHSISTEVIYVTSFDEGRPREKVDNK